MVRRFPFQSRRSANSVTVRARVCCRLRHCWRRRGAFGDDGVVVRRVGGLTGKGGNLGLNQFPDQPQLVGVLAVTPYSVRIATKTAICVAPSLTARVPRRQRELAIVLDAAHEISTTIAARYCARGTWATAAFPHASRIEKRCLGRLFSAPDIIIVDQARNTADEFNCQNIAIDRVDFAIAKLSVSDTIADCEYNSFLSPGFL